MRALLSKQAPWQMASLAGDRASRCASKVPPVEEKSSKQRRPRLFPDGYFKSPEWATAAAALTEVATCRNAAELWAVVAEHSPAPRCDGGAADNDYEPVLDAIQCCSGFECLFSETIPAMAKLAARAPRLFGTNDALAAAAKLAVSWSAASTRGAGNMLTPYYTALAAAHPECTTPVEALEAMDAAVLRLLPSGVPGTVALSREQVASLLAMSALGLGLPAEAYDRGSPDSGTYPTPSMLPLIWPKRCCDFPPNVEKLKCFLEYFRSLSQASMMDGTQAKVKITRIVAGVGAAAAKLGAQEWAESTVPLCDLVVQPLLTSIDEQQGGCVRVDFANAQVGGGVFLSAPGSTAQEEIAFATHPELCVSKLLCEGMADNEALLISGARHMSLHTGYQASFQFLGPASGKAPDVSAWLAIDALQYPDQGPAAQFRDVGKACRELVKALTGFQGSVAVCGGGGTASGAVVATGLWGCGAFNGDPEVKALIQLMAASQAGVARVLFHPWDDEVTADALSQLAAVCHGASVGELWHAATSVAARMAASPLEGNRGDFLNAVAAAVRDSAARV